MKLTIKSAFATLFVAAGMFMNVRAAVQHSPLVQTDDGPVRGVRQGQLLSWLGVPYAAPPTGSLRWMPPQRPRPWSAPLSANKYGSFCPQNADLGVFAKAGGSEDCLTLNVFVSEKSLRAKEPLPVFFWIHGGAMRVGAARDYDPAKLAIDGGVVVVTINYRLGLFGYFAHPALQREGQPGVNYAIMDQQLALDWVQRNIQRFGGDPRNVTIAGESAGGDSVIAHLVSPGSAGKFQHAVSMSGNAIVLKYPTFGAPKTLEWAETVAQDFAKKVGCVKEDVASCLRSLPTRDILANQTPYYAQQVIVDGKVMPMRPGDALRTGHINPVSTFINGTTLDEGAFFSGYLENESGRSMDEEAYVKMSDAFFGSNAKMVREQYATSAYPTPSDAFAAAATDMLFACTAHAVNGWLAPRVPTYAYEFADRTAPSYLKPTTFALGAAHTSELAYLFPKYHGGAGIPVTLNPLQAGLSEQMVRYWTSAKKMTEAEGDWTSYDAAQENIMTLALPHPRMTTHSFSKTHKCAFWDSLNLY
jgi:para-nitrobenzyl esterase